MEDKLETVAFAAILISPFILFIMAAVSTAA